MINATELRSDIYNKLGSVIATGLPIEVEYKGHIVYITNTPPTGMSDTDYINSIPGLKESILAVSREPIKSCSKIIDW